MILVINDYDKENYKTDKSNNNDRNSNDEDYYYYYYYYSFLIIVFFCNNSLNNDTINDAAKLLHSVENMCFNEAWL